jgi:hypothetical protein
MVYLMVCHNNEEWQEFVINTTISLPCRYYVFEKVSAKFLYLEGNKYILTDENITEFGTDVSAEFALLHFLEN